MISTANWVVNERTDFAKLNIRLANEFAVTPKNLQNAWGKGGNQGTKAVFVSININRVLFAEVDRKQFDKWFRDLTNRFHDVAVCHPYQS